MIIIISVSATPKLLFSEEIFFKSGVTKIEQLLEEEREKLDSITYFLLLCERCKVEIEGFADKTGSEIINERVAKERADAMFLALKPLVNEKYVEWSVNSFGEQGEGKNSNRMASVRVSWCD